MGSKDDSKAVRSYQDLEVWKKAMDLVVVTCKVINGFPQHEVYGLTSQMKRASVSVAANIAERLGCLVSERVRQFLGRTSEVGRMLNGLRKSLERKCE